MLTLHDLFIWKKFLDILVYSTLGSLNIISTALAILFIYGASLITSCMYMYTNMASAFTLALMTQHPSYEGAAPVAKSPDLH